MENNEIINLGRCKLEFVTINPFGNSTILGSKVKSESQIITFGKMEEGMKLKLDSILKDSVASHCLDITT